jgi:D-beta-D-heptose 7-phosphate kinase/D-beta-D-heptose 1-phosphate adenosyltransferase
MAKIAVSGGFDPLHVGHLELIRRASKYGDVVVILNSDEWLIRKKGYVFMPWEQRAELLMALKGVTQITWVDDSDDTVCEAIRRLMPDSFGNGGDRVDTNTPEHDLCEELGIKMIYGLGHKIQSSSALVDKIRGKCDKCLGSK